jgi:predicted TPR repeat methyltransferase
MNLKRSPFSILDKEKREIDYIKGVYKRKIQAEIESYKDPEDEDEDKRDTIQAQDILMLDRISI